MSMKAMNLHTHSQEAIKGSINENHSNENQSHYDEFVEMALWFTKEIQREHIGLSSVALKKQ